MAILKGSRYEGCAYTGIRFKDGTDKKLLHDRRIYSPEDVGTQGVEHTVVGSETLDSIADDYYGDDTLWFLIADVNNVFFMYDVLPGDIVVVPDPAIRLKTKK